MKKSETNEYRMALVVTFVITFVLLTSPVMAQRRSAPSRKPAPRQIAQPPPTFDSLIAADSYRIYGEVRGVGSLIRSSAIKDLLDPVMKLTFGGPSKEFKTTLKWLNAHADVLASSRMMAAGWPTRPKLPTILIAIEFSSAEEAQKFEPDLRGLMPTLIPTPTPAPTPAASTPNPCLRPGVRTAGRMPAPHRSTPRPRAAN